MHVKPKEKLVNKLSDLVKEGHYVQESGRQAGVNAQFFEKWLFGCRNIIHLIGRPAQMWHEIFHRDNPPLLQNVQQLLGALEALREAVESDLLIRLDNLIIADAFDNVLEQAQQLTEKGYTLAAGVLARTVLEEHLRKLCDRNSCLPPGRPTINDLNQVLYKTANIDKIQMHAVTAMTSAGNHCAHNEQPPLHDLEVQKLLDDVRHFLERNPL